MKVKVIYRCQRSRAIITHPHILIIDISHKGDAELKSVTGNPLGMVFTYFRADQSMIFGDWALVYDHLNFGTAVCIINGHDHLLGIDFIEVEHHVLKGGIEALDGLGTSALTVSI